MGHSWLFETHSLLCRYLISPYYYATNMIYQISVNLVLGFYPRCSLRHVWITPALSRDQTMIQLYITSVLSEKNGTGIRGYYSGDLRDGINCQLLPATQTSRHRMAHNVGPSLHSWSKQTQPVLFSVKYAFAAHRFGFWTLKDTINVTDTLKRRLISRTSVSWISRSHYWVRAVTRLTACVGLTT